MILTHLLYFSFPSVTSFSSVKECSLVPWCRSEFLSHSVPCLCIPIPLHSALKNARTQIFRHGNEIHLDTVLKRDRNQDRQHLRAHTFLRKARVHLWKNSIYLEGGKKKSKIFQQLIMGNPCLNSTVRPSLQTTGGSSVCPAGAGLCPGRYVYKCVLRLAEIVISYLSMF